MEKIKCSYNEHKNVDAIKVCCDCKIYMCNKSEKLHSGLFINHNVYNLEHNINNIFSGFCKQENHFDKLDYFCKTHNTLCCSACIVKVKKKGRGQHSECDVCIIEDIKNEKKEILQKNVKELENISDSIHTSIKELKETFEQIYNNKENIKMKIQKTFTDIRNYLNKREDELLSKVDNEFDKLVIDENKIKDLEKLPNKVKISIDKVNNINNGWDDENKLCSLINECLNIENSIKDIKILNSNNLKFTSFDIEFNITEKEMNTLKNIISNFGYIGENNKFLKSEIKLNNLKDYSLSGENNDIITKVGSDGYRGTIILNELQKNKVHTWRIKLLNSRDNFHFYVGVASSEFDANKSYSDCGWYFYCWNGRLYSGPPHKFSGKSTKINSAKNEIILIMNMKERTLKFIIDNKDDNIIYNDIPIDKPLYPAIYMYYTKDSLQFIKG